MRGRIVTEPRELVEARPHEDVVIDDGGRADEAQMIELWRELELPFVSETLAFLPRTPILLKMGAKQAEIAELRRLKDLP